MEKADILEMTVKHLKEVYRSQAQGVSKEVSPSSIASQYRYGFNECISKVSQFFSEIDDSHLGMRSRLMNHLVTTFNSATGPPAKRQQQSRAAPYQQPVQIHLQPCETHLTTRESRYSHRQLLQSSQGSHPGTIIGVISQVIEPQPISATHHVTAMTSVARIVSGIPIGFTSPITPGEVSLVLPQHSISSAGLQTHLIPVPVYAGGMSGLSSNFTSMRVASSVIPVSEPRIQSEAASESESDSIMMPTRVISDFSHVLHESSSRGNSSDVQSDDNHSVHEAAEMQQIENENVGVDPMWRPW
ncbi:transcription factor HES-4-B-like [Anneissia japonica]|uniref:transcription factor HES-4-B-like n=1 Tax=Anneissia japonica TaxID=1529436 RepID=UPI0014259F0F|nr:transcription factor HES-4-B-like [Anneissia japonica]